MKIASQYALSDVNINTINIGLTFIDTENLPCLKQVQFHITGNGRVTFY